MKSYLTFAIFLELIHHNPTTANYLAEKFEISTRTVYRYISELESAGIPTISRPGKNGGIGIEKNFVLDKLLFTPEELSYLKQSLLLNKNGYLTEKIFKKLNINNCI